MVLNKRNSIRNTTRRRLLEQGTYLVNRMRSQGEPDEKILDALMLTGLTRPEASNLLSGGQLTLKSAVTMSPQAGKPAARSGKWNDQVILGIFMMVIGLGITAASVAAASQRGGYYVMTTGLIAWGIALIIKGLMKR